VGTDIRQGDSGYKRETLGAYYFMGACSYEGGSYFAKKRRLRGEVETLGGFSQKSPI